MRWYFSFRFVDEFAQQLVDEVSGLLPPDDSGPRTKGVAAKREKRSERAVALLRTKVSDFRSAQKLNLFQRARLSQKLQNGLIARGHPVELAQEIALSAIG